MEAGGREDDRPHRDGQEDGPGQAHQSRGLRGQKAEMSFRKQMLLFHQHRVDNYKVDFTYEAIGSAGRFYLCKIYFAKLFKFDHVVYL